jgi:hypothetical protein
MESLPYELVDMIGANLLPMWRCRLYLCCKVWYDTCYLMQRDLFSWHNCVAFTNKEIKEIRYNIYDTKVYERLSHRDCNISVDSINFHPIHTSRRIIHNNDVYMTNFISYNCTSLLISSRSQCYHYIFDNHGKTRLPIMSDNDLMINYVSSKSAFMKYYLRHCNSYEYTLYKVSKIIIENCVGLDTKTFLHMIEAFGKKSIYMLVRVYCT